MLKVCLLWCLDKGFQLPKNGTLAPAPENVNFGKVVVMPELDFKEVPDKGLIVNIPFIKFRCEFEEQEGLFYNVAWLDFFRYSVSVLFANAVLLLYTQLQIHRTDLK